MEPLQPDRSGVLIVRVWRELGQTPRFRARIVQVDNVTSPERAVAVADNVDDICAAVRTWLEQFAVQ